MLKQTLIMGEALLVGVRDPLHDSVARGVRALTKRRKLPKEFYVAKTGKLQPKPSGPFSARHRSHPEGPQERLPDAARRGATEAIDLEVVAHGA